MKQYPPVSVNLRTVGFVILAVGTILIAIVEADRMGKSHGRAMATGSPAVAVQPSWTDVGIVTDVQPVYNTLTHEAEAMVKTDYGDFIWVAGVVTISQGQAQAEVCTSLGQLRISNVGNHANPHIYSLEAPR